MKKSRAKRDTSQRGYALIGLMAVLMFALILTTAAAPQVKMDMQREKEEEMLWRGQQIAIALKRYANLRGSPPLDLTDLVNGVEVGAGKKIKLLRRSALCDPMTPCTPGTPNWRSVHPGDPLVKELLDAYLAARERGPAILPPPPGNLVAFAQMGSVKLPGQPSDTTLDGTIGQPQDEAQGEDSKLKKKPIIGVVSKREGTMFRNYFGITEYDRTLFFPDVHVIVSGFVNPLILAPTLTNGGRDNRCPAGGVMIDGKCWGNLNPGKCPPDRRDPTTGKCS